MAAPDLPHVTSEITQRYSAAGNFSAYTWRNVAIFVWSDAPTVESLAGYERCCSELIAAYPDGFSAVGFLVPGGRLPTPQVREDLSRIADMLAERLAGMALVVLGTGFWASALRGLLTAIHMLLRKTIPMQVFSKLEDAVPWLIDRHARTGMSIESHELRAVLDHVAARELLDASPRRKVA
jgi:hypothetical protein